MVFAHTILVWTQGPDGLRGARARRAQLSGDEAPIPAIPSGSMIDFRRLRYFVTVARERSFTRAAACLNMAQPPLSRRIQEIEEEVGTRLIDRDARPLVLTPAGRLFYEQALQVLQRHNQMQAVMHRYVQHERPRFVVGLIPSGFHARLPQLIRRFRVMAPDVDLSLQELTSHEQVTALKEGRIDVGLGRVRVEDDAIRRQVLREEALLVALAPNSPLTTAKGPLDLAELATTPLILYPCEPRPSYADAILSLFSDLGITLEMTIEVRELHTALIMAAAGEGACIVPASAHMLAHPDVVFRPTLQPVTSPIILSHRMGDTSPALETLLRAFAGLYTEWGFPISASLRERLSPSQADPRPQGL
ncbi:MAG: LysR family transcriptional regulator [Azospirillaceae bacterium]|nr:LysR family transcriptional regulator [Azospirillaceae bacterium]